MGFSRLFWHGPNGFAVLLVRNQFTRTFIFKFCRAVNVTSKFYKNKHYYFRKPPPDISALALGSCLKERNFCIALITFFSRRSNVVD